MLVPFLVAGLVASATSPATTRHRIWRLCVALPVLAGGLVLIRGPEAFQGRTLLLNIAGVFPVVDVVGSIRLSTLTLYGVAAMLVVGLLLRSHFVAGSLVLTSVFVGFGALAIDRSAAAIDVLDTQDQLIAAIEESAVDADCVALDIWQLPPLRIRRIIGYASTINGSSTGAVPRPAGIPISSSTPSDPTSTTSYPAQPVIAVEPYGRQALWVLPGARQDAINVQRQTITDPLAAFATDQDIIVRIETPPLSVALGDSFEAVATIENRGPLGLFSRGRVRGRSRVRPTWASSFAFPENPTSVDTNPSGSVSPSPWQRERQSSSPDRCVPRTSIRRSNQAPTCWWRRLCRKASHGPTSPMPSRSR